MKFEQYKQRIITLYNILYRRDREGIKYNIFYLYIYTQYTHKKTYHFRQ